jgi:hypothetical protein
VKKSPPRREKPITGAALDETGRRALVSGVMALRAKGYSYADLYASMGGDPEQARRELVDAEAALAAAMGVDVDAVSYSALVRWAEDGRRPRAGS